jgi:CheY-like chemotaxis protein
MNLISLLKEGFRPMTTKPILLVEDTPDDADLTILSLKETGLLNEIVVTEDGVEALDYLFATGRYASRDPQIIPALILLDLKMPRMDGIEFLNRLRADERTKLLPVVMLTTSKEDVDLLRAYESGANAYVRKPVSLAEFGQAVQKLGMFWLLLNEPPPSGAW